RGKHQVHRLVGSAQGFHNREIFPLLQNRAGESRGHAEHNQTTITVELARTTERVLPTTAVCTAVIWRTGFTSSWGKSELSREMASSISCGRPSTRRRAVFGWTPVRDVNCCRSI